MLIVQSPSVIVTSLKHQQSSGHTRLKKPTKTFALSVFGYIFGKFLIDLVQKKNKLLGILEKVTVQI